MAHPDHPATISSSLLTSLTEHDEHPHEGISEEDQHYFAEGVGAPGLNEPIVLANMDMTPSNPGYYVEETRAFMAERRAASALTTTTSQTSE